MSIITYPPNSAYFSTTQTSWHINQFVMRKIRPNAGDTLITLTQMYQYRPDRLAYDLYRSSSYWWIFAVRNPFLRPDPIWNFIVGVTLTVPSASYLTSVLGS
jgi:hypothetical protein